MYIYITNFHNHITIYIYIYIYIYKYMCILLGMSINVMNIILTHARSDDRIGVHDG